MSESVSSSYDTHIESVTVGEQAIIEIEACYRDGIDPKEVIQTHLDVAAAMKYYLKWGTVRKP